MDMKNVNNLESKLKLWQTIDLASWAICMLSMLVAAVSVTMHWLTLGYILVGAALLTSLVGGFAHVYISVLGVELTRCNVRKDHVKEHVRSYAETAGRKTMEDAQQLGKELEDEDEVL